MAISLGDRGGQGCRGVTSTVAARLIFMYRLNMNPSIVRTEKRSRGRPKTDAKSIHLTLVPEALDVLDAYISAQPDPKPSRPEAIRVLLQEALAAKGPLTQPYAESSIGDRVEALEAKVASIPAQGAPSPDAAMNTMKRALAEAELVELRKRRKRVRKAKP